MNKIIDIVILPFIIIIGLAFAILVLPLLIVFWPIYYVYAKITDRQLKSYLIDLGDKNFFCYNNRADAKDFIEKELLPRLDKNIELIYLDGRQPKSSYEKDKISLTLYKLKKYTRFPHLLKVRSGQIIDESINNEFFNTMKQNKPIDKLVSDINNFFGLQKYKNAA